MTWHRGFGFAVLILPDCFLFEQDQNKILKKLPDFLKKSGSFVHDNRPLAKIFLPHPNPKRKRGGN
ncbi:hypothetical protein B4U84_12330 [Westiellopsis prolifica IICB1]|nr:hypothetical protein B4U84_12330 [Westiellopsis prolifica IICB1]